MTESSEPIAELPLVAWRWTGVQVPEKGLAIDRRATPAELAALAGALDLRACTTLRFTGSLTAAGGGRFRLLGTARADIVQTCVVSLEPLPRTLEAPVAVVFAPAEGDTRSEWLAPGEVADIDPFSEDEEPMLGGGIEVGRVVFEEIAACIDAFPRRPDAALEWQDTKPQSDSTHPFAKLSALRDRQKKP